MNKDLNDSKEHDRKTFNLTEVKETADERSVSNASKVQHKHVVKQVTK